MKLDAERILKELGDHNKTKLWLAEHLGMSKQKLYYVLKEQTVKYAGEIAEILGLEHKDVIQYGTRMKNYLSFGGGVNSVALYLYLVDQGWDFEACFVDHYTDWPETYEYFDYFQNWIISQGLKPITVLYPNEDPPSLYQYCWDRKLIPNKTKRWCTSIFKVKRLMEYYETPAFELIGFDAGEMYRVARIQVKKHSEMRFPLIEADMDRNDCINYIKEKGLKIPQKSGCFFCPFQKEDQWWQLRRKHPDLYCKAVELEKRFAKDRKLKKKPVYYLRKQTTPSLFEEDNPPCLCMV